MIAGIVSMITKRKGVTCIELNNDNCDCDTCDSCDNCDNCQYCDNCQSCDCHCEGR